MRIRLLTAGAVVVLCGAIVIAQGPDPQTLGPQVGDRVPDFSLQDQSGRSRTLQSTFGPKGAVLVFFRSADW
jgi:hypothetical protein